jgi:predicted small lipoprotein YifL
MKKSWMTALLLALLLALSACGAEEAPTTPPQSGEEAPSAADKPQTTEEPAQSAELPSAAMLGREEHSAVEVSLEGEEESMPATLYVGLAPTDCAYSLYIPDEGWKLDGPGEWEAAANEDVELKILCFAYNDPEAARKEILTEYENFGFLDMDGDGRFSGVDGEDGLVMEVQIKTGPGETFAILYAYPDEAAEGFGARLAGIADTFRTEVESLAE